MLKCRDVTEMTTDYLDGSLTLPHRMGMRWHLSICSFCRRHIKQVRATISLLRADTGSVVYTTTRTGAKP